MKAQSNGLNEPREVVWEELDGGALVIDAAAHSAWTLNATATYIWRFCECRGIERLIEELSRAGHQAARDVEVDVRGFIQQLSTHGLRVATGTHAVDDGCAFHGAYSAPSFKLQNLGSAGRRRPSPRGNSGPG